MTDVTDSLDADTFKRLYPDQYYAKFIAQSLRPDGRPFHRCRPASIALNAVSSADSSALIRIGNTTALAGIKCEVMATTDSSPDRGNLVITVEIPPLCSTTTRPGRPSSSSAILTHKITSLFSKLNILDTRQLCIDKGRAAWAVYVDIYILDADGSLLDACLLAAVAALSSLQLKSVEVDDIGNVVNKTNNDNNMDEDNNSDNNSSRGRLQLSMQPSSLTCGLYINTDNSEEDRLLVDLTSEEEGLVDCVIETTTNERGEVLAMEKPGGTRTASVSQLMRCVAAAKARCEELAGLLVNEREGGMEGR